MIYAGKRKAEDAYLGTKKVLRMFLGDAMVYAIGHSVACSLIGCSANAPATVPEGSRLQVTLTPYASKTICDAEVSVYMGGTDITAAAYSNGVVSIPDVTGNVTISAAAYEIISFASSAVKTICLAQTHAAGTPLGGQPWAGNHFSGEMTAEEAALVMTLNGAFYQQLGRGSKPYTYYTFNELRYFTGLTTLYVGLASSYSAGEFYQCTGLTAVTLPAAPIANQAGAFRGCSSLETLDLTPITDAHLQLGSICRACSSLTYVKIKGGTYQSVSGGTVGMTYAFRDCSSLTRMDIDGTADFSKVTNFANFLVGCTALTTVTGTITGISYDLDLHSCPLNIISAVMFLNGLANVSTARTLTFNASMRSTYEADTNFAAAINAIPPKWTVAWS